MERSKQIIRTSIIGIITNLFLSGFKAVIGFLSGSIAIVLDAVNNLSDALSSTITIIGTKLAKKKPDKKHPLGHGRIEYVSALSISIIILYAGIAALEKSVGKIIHPTTPDYKPVGMIIIAVAVVTKIILGLYVKKVGENVNSDALVASGKDALMDSVISASTLVAAIIFTIWKISIEAWLGAVISVIIIKAGVDMIRETLSQIIGERVDCEISQKVRKTIADFEDVNGAYDLILHNYGPDKLIGSVHIEVPDTYTISQLDRLERAIAKKVYAEHGVMLEGIGIYSINTVDKEVQKIKKSIDDMIFSYEHVLQMHGFHIDNVSMEMRFDVVISFEAEDRHEIYEKILKRVREMYPEYDVQITLDTDISDF